MEADAVECGNARFVGGMVFCCFLIRLSIAVGEGIAGVELGCNEGDMYGRRIVFRVSVYNSCFFFYC